MRSVILGAKGQLGRDLCRAFRPSGEILALDQDDADITDEADIFPLIKAFAPDIVVNAAAYTDVERAEDELEPAFMTNEAGARNVADVAAYLNIPVVYFSTDYVFGDGHTTPIPPGATLNPQSVYAKSKAAGEAATRKANPQHIIIRTAWLYGPGGNNFIEKILRAAATRNELRVVEDEVGSPTHTHDLAEATYYLARAREYGTYHVVNRGACSRFELARAIIQYGELPVKVVPCASTEFPTKASRPKYSVLDPSAAEAVTGHKMRPWRDALNDYLHRREAVIEK